MRATLTVLAVAMVAGHLSSWSSAAPQDEAATRDTLLPLATVQDLNADPRVLEFDLAADEAEVEISPGRRVKAWTYNGSLPGPLIRARVGDRVIVHFTNRLPAPTTVHWHGLQIPFAMDGVPEHSQPEIRPGGTFTYDFTLPDAGLYWYHPHVMSAAQVGFGLYGAFLVDDPGESFAAAAEEHVLVLSDIDLTDRNTLESPESGGSAGMAFGREGNVLLFNGREHTEVTARPGVMQRWRIVNAAKSRYFELDPGEGQSFTKIGGDGGLREYQTTHDTMVVTPGERADLFFTPMGEPGTVLPITAQLADRGYGSIEARNSAVLFSLALRGPAPASIAAHPRTSRVIAPLDRANATRVDIEFGIGRAADQSFQYTINGKPLGRFPAVHARVGDTQIWTVTNTTAWSHPFHLHGFFFQVLDKNGEPVRPLEWKDTVNVPYKDKLSLAVRYDDRPGMWMFHCHVLDHADGGLMGMVMLEK